MPDTVEEKHSSTLFVDLLLPVPIPRLFTYRVPRELNDAVLTGLRAIVQFGDRKILTGVIINIHNTPPSDYEAKYILELLDVYPVTTPQQLQFFSWIADYYACTQGEVLKAALPAGLKLSSESRVQIRPGFDPETSDQILADKEIILLRHLRHEPMDYTAISKLLGIKNVYNILKSLVKKDAIIIFEEIREKYKPKTEKRIRLAEEFVTDVSLEALFKQLGARPKQEEVLLRYLQLVPVLTHPEENEKGCSKSELVEHDGISASSLQTLVKNGILEEFEKIVSRFGDNEQGTNAAIPLSTDQQHAFNEILLAFNTHPTTLLHGITGSGKTEIYINLIREVIAAGSQVLYLLPEIALTTQIVQRLRKVFGGVMGIYHSRFSDAERVEVWNGVISGTFRFVVGVRSSVFLPFDNLGLIIVDEEHEPSYKQQEPAPRYNARDSAIMLSQIHHAKTLLGSATPAVETWFNARQGRYGYVPLTKRYGDAALPQVRIADMGQERRKKTIKGEFSSLLLKQITEALSRDEQVIIFQNRRGYSPVLSCEDCGWVPQCINCAVSLTYHQFRHALVCHYCGYREKLPATCASCSSTRLKTVGYGTEKLEEELTIQFPDVQVRRMDLDTTRSKSSYETIIEEFERGDTRILVGTQMVTKGLDFDHVSLVGIFNADRMVHFPDFRAHERAYQLITQVSGRAGRRDKPGTVVIQTSGPNHPVLQTILRNDQEQFYRKEIEDRQRHGYPPFTRLIEITIKHADKKACVSSSQALAALLREQIPLVRTLGPAEPFIGKIRNLYLMKILLKIPRGKGDLSQIKATVTAQTEVLLKEKEHRNTRFIIDVDPL
ncbi:MAG TPA: primosomal protein N' [Ohtaekwangia sp.]|nr:primosomal protein N' [Ohtaekwangia sp.]